MEKPTVLSFKVGIYVRESRDDDEENYETIETQRDLLVDFVRKNSLGEIIRVYLDDNVSGSTFERKGILELKKDAREGRINLLILKDLSRLGRNNAKTLLFLDFLEEYAVRIITFDGRYDSIRDNDTVGIDTWYNERYIRDISRKIRANLRFKIEKGEYIGNAPFGYVKALKGRNQLSVDSSTAHIVRLIFKMYLEGYGYSYIAKRLNSLCVPTPAEKNHAGNHKNQWNGVGVKRILFNRVYLGDTIQGVSEKVSFKSKKTRRLPKEQWVITENTHEPIITREEFFQAERIRNSKKLFGGQHKGGLHFFKGLIFCGSCGNPMYARKRKEKPMGYVCSLYLKQGCGACSSHYVPEGVLMEELVKEMKRRIQDETKKNDILELIRKEMREYCQSSEIDKLERVLYSKQKQQEVIYLDYLEGKISERLFQRTNTTIEARIAQLRHEIDKTKSRGTKELSPIDVIEKLIHIEVQEIGHTMIREWINRIIVLEPKDITHSKKEETRELDAYRSTGAIVMQFTLPP